MKEEKRELASWFKDLQKIELENVDKLPENITYGKGVSSIFSYTPNFSGTPPEYNVKHIDKELELYTLIEATQTIGINDILKGILNSPLIPENKTRLDSSLFSNIQNGLVCYVQPKINDGGELLSHNLELETYLQEKSSSDLFVIIVKAGAKLNLTHKFLSGVDNSILGRKIIVLCEDGSVIRFKEEIKEVRGALSLQYIFLVGPQSNVTFVNTGTANIILRQNVESYLLTDGANSSIENVYIAKRDSKFDITCVSYQKSDSTHSTIHTGAIVEDSSHLIYRSGIISSFDNNASVDEGRLLLVGDDSKIDTLPIKDAHSIRQVSESHLMSVDNMAIEQFLGRIISKEHIDEVIKK